MARIRTVKPSLFRHLELYQAEVETGLPLRIAWVGLFCCCDREGRFEWKPHELKLDCLPFDPLDFSLVLDAFATRGFIVKYTVGTRHYGVIPTFQIHQFINHREIPSKLPAPPFDTRKERVDDALSTRHGYARGEEEGEGRVEGEREGERIKNKNLSSEKLSTNSTDSASVVDNSKTESKASDPSGSDEDRGGEEKPSQEPTPESKPEPVVESAPSVEPTAVPTRGKVWGSDEDVATARWMHKQIAEVAPSIKGVNFDAWGNAIRLMRELDQHSDAEIRAMFEWANADAFWRTVILSPGTLRSKWVQLEAKRLAEQGAGSANGHRKGANGSRAGWWESQDGITAKGVELKLIPAAGEDWSVYKGRVVAELERRGMPVYVK